MIDKHSYICTNANSSSDKSQHSTESYTPIVYLWEGTVSDIIELSIALHKAELIRKPTGELITYAEILRAFEIIFNIKLPKNIYSRKTRTMERKKNASPLLERMLALYRHEVDRMYSQ